MNRVLIVWAFGLLLSLWGVFASAQHPRDSCYDSPASACDPCGFAKPEPCEKSIFCDSTPGCKKSSLWDKVSVYGWIEMGIQTNNHGCTNEYTDAPNGPCSRNLDAFSGNTYLLMTQQQTDFHVNQVWVGVSKKLDTRRGFDWGFQMDTFFGTDGKYGQSFGDHTFDYDWGTGDYNTAIPQLYAEVGYRNLKVRVGKFASTMTHEALPAPATFFYSHAYGCFNTPLTFSGVIAEYKVSDRVSFSGGWTAGYHNSLVNRFDDSGFLGNFTVRPTDKTNISYNIYFGRSNGFDSVADAGNYGRYYDTATHVTQTIIFTWNISKKWMYMIEGVWNNNNYEWGPTDWSTNAHGINQHLIYTINKQWAVGARIEWSHAKGTIFDITGQGADLYELTFGANWTPTPNFILRPELRYDWCNYYDGFKPFGNMKHSDQLSGGCAAIFKF